MTSDFNLLLNLETDPCNPLRSPSSSSEQSWSTCPSSYGMCICYWLASIEVKSLSVVGSSIELLHLFAIGVNTDGQLAFEDSSFLTCSFCSPFIPSIVHRGLQVCYQSWTMIESKGKGIRISGAAFQWATWDPWSLWSTLFTCLLPQSWSAIVLQSILSSFSTSSSCRVLCSSLGVVGLNGRVFLNWRASWSRTLTKCPSGFLKSLQSVASKVSWFLHHNGK